MTTTRTRETTTTALAERNAEALFADRSLEEIREIERRTRREASEKAEALRYVRVDAVRWRKGSRGRATRGRWGGTRARRETD